MSQREKSDKLNIAVRELAFQNEEKEKRAAELMIANKELAYQNQEKEKRAAELVIANKDLERAINAAQVAVELYDFAPTGYFTLSRKGEIKELNLYGASMLGKERPHIRNIQLVSFISEDTRPVFNLFLTKILNSKAKESCEVTLLKEGTFQLFVHLTGIITKSGDQCLVTVVDITERRQAEEALIERERNYREIFEASNNALFVLDIATGLIIDVNTTMLKMYGYADKQEVLACSIESLSALEEGYEEKKINEMNQKAIDSNSNIFEWRSKKNNGAVFWSQVSLQRIQIGGKSRILGSVLDISERKHAEIKLQESEERLQSLIEHSGEGILHTKPDGTIISANPQACHIFGRSEEELILVGRQGLLDSSDPRLAAALSDRSRSGAFNGELNFLRKDGTVFPCEFSSNVYKSASGEPHTSLFIRDITERKKSEQIIKIKNEALEKLNAEKDKFFSLIAHDLRNPFNSLLGLTQMLTEELPAMTREQIERSAVTLRKSATKLHDLLEDLLEWSQMQRGLIIFNPESFMLLNGIALVLEMIQDAADRKMIRISIEIPSELTVFADVQMFKSLMRNLLSNAIKFTPKGGNITIAAKSMSSDSVEVSIKDTGIGMNRSLVDNLFSLTEQTNRKGTEGEPSSGLGLVICKDFIEKHGGKLWVESDESWGSVFWFTLPNHTP